MTIPNPEYVSELFREINTQIRNDKLYWKRCELETRLETTPKKEDTNITSAKERVVKAQRELMSNDNLHIYSKKDLSQYIDSMIEESKILDFSIFAEHDLESRRGRSQMIANLVHAAIIYDKEITKEKINREIVRERNDLDTCIKLIDDTIGTEHKPFLGKDSITAYQQVPDNAAYNFSTLSKDKQQEIISSFIRFMIADKFPKELIKRYPNDAKYKETKKYFSELAKRINN